MCTLPFPKNKARRGNCMLARRGGILCLIRLILQECCLLMWGIGKGTLIEASDTVIRKKR